MYQLRREGPRPLHKLRVRLDTEMVLHSLIELGLVEMGEGKFHIHSTTKDVYRLTWQGGAFIDSFDYSRGKRLMATLMEWYEEDDLGRLTDIEVK